MINHCFSNIYTFGYFQITLFDGDAPPRVSCKTEILHPNIRYEEQGHAVCLNIFDEWEAHFGLDDIIQGLLFLFHEPNWDDPLNEYFFIIMNNKNELSYAEIIQKTLLGLDVAGKDWPFNYEGDDLEELKAKYTGSVINTSKIPQAPPLPQNLLSSNANNIPSSPTQQQNITSNSANEKPPSPTQQQNISSDSVNNIPPAPPLPQNLLSSNANNIPSSPPQQQNITSNSANDIPSSPPQQQNITSNSANDIPSSPPQQQNITSNSANDIPSSPPQQQNITSNSANDLPSSPPQQQNITSNSANDKPPAQTLPQNISSSNVNNIPPAPPLPQIVTSDIVNRITPVTLEPPQQIILHNAVPGPFLTNCLRHGELPIKQLNDEIPVLPVHDRGVTVGAASQMCDCLHGAAVQYSDDTHTDTMGHRQKPKHRTMRSRFVKYLGNILKIKRRTSSHKR